MARNTPARLRLSLAQRNRHPKRPTGSLTNRTTSTPAGVKMPPDLVPWLIGLALAGLVGFLYWAEKRYPSPSKPRDPDLAPTLCAWCEHRAGDHCTHPGSPVYGQPCGPVCIGSEWCDVREVKRWGSRREDHQTRGVIRRVYRKSVGTSTQPFGQ
jgi:hypothetical protein